MPRPRPAGAEEHGPAGRGGRQADGGAEEEARAAPHREAGQAAARDDLDEPQGPVA